MLKTLRVTDFAVIEQAELDLDAPFVVLTGETGAGKSLLVDAVGLLTGGRAAAGMVRTGSKRLLVEGEFEGVRSPELLAKLDAVGISVEAEEPIVLRREVAAGGRSRAWVNGSLVGVGFLSDIAGSLVRIRGQNEAPDLADAERARDTLDRFGNLGADRAALSKSFSEWRALDAECERLATGERERESRLDFARFQLEEIRQVDPRPEEDEQLTRERSRLAHAAKLGEAASEAFDRISEGDGSAGEQVGRARKALAPLASLVPEAGEILSAIDDLAGRIDELGRQVADLASSTEPDPARLEKVDDRLEKIRRLLRKHGGTIPELLEKQTALVAEVAELEGASDALAKLAPRRDLALAHYGELADRLSAARRKAAPKLAKAVLRHLADLGMPATTLEFRFGVATRGASPLLREGKPCEFGEAGFDQIELVASPNPGEALRPLARIASGGELSRIQLALAAALLGGDRHTALTVVFDEIDSGVGGAAAIGVGRKLADLARDEQVLCVTHLATIAAQARRHYRVVKAVEGERTRVSIEPLEGERRIDELARMLSGQPQAREARDHARALLDEAGR